MSDLNITLNITWEYPTGAESSVIIEGTTLTVTDVSKSSEGDYRCIVHSNLQGSVTAVGTLRIGMWMRSKSLPFPLSVCIHEHLT